LNRLGLFVFRFTGLPPAFASMCRLASDSFRPKVTVLPILTVFFACGVLLLYASEICGPLPPVGLRGFALLLPAASADGVLAMLLGVLMGAPADTVRCGLTWFFGVARRASSSIVSATEGRRFSSGDFASAFASPAASLLRVCAAPCPALCCLLL
jgi:hypothetical protein